MKNLVLDSQILTSLSHCPRRCKHTFIDRLIAIEPNPSFEKGSMVHEALEVYYRGIKEGKDFDTRYNEALVSAHKFGTLETQLPESEVQSVLKTLDEYFKYRRDDRIIVKEVEVPFSKVLYSGTDLRGEDIEIIYQGKIDLIAEEEPYGEVVIDHKTTSRNYPPNDMRIQFLGYHWATGLTVVENRIGFQTSKSPGEKFKRFPFHYNEEVIDSWEKFAIHKALEYAYYLETGEWPQNFGACETKFGVCSYIELCRYPSLFEETVRFSFRVGEPWDVYSERNT